MNITAQPYSHERTAITIVVLVCGTLLLVLHGDQAAVLALVSSAWTLTLTFWFRLGIDATR